MQCFKSASCLGAPDEFLLTVRFDGLQRWRPGREARIRTEIFKQRIGLSVGRVDLTRYFDASPPRMTKTQPCFGFRSARSREEQLGAQFGSGF